MTPRGGRTAARLAAGLAAVLLMGGLAALPAIAAPDDDPTDDPSAEEPGLPLQVSILDMEPVLGPGEDLHLRVQLRNDGAEAVARPRVLVHLDRDPFISRSSLDRWRDGGDDGAIGTAIQWHDLPAPLGPGQSVTTDITVPAASIALPRRTSSWGARGLAVQTVDVDDPVRARLGLARTFLLWFPEQEVTATRLSVVVPVTGTGVDPLGTDWVAHLEQLTANEGQLAALLDATADHPEVTWVVDPWLTDVANGAGESAEAWATAFRDAAVDREVALLPYLDPDLAALAHAGADPLLRTAIARAEDTRAGLPDSAQVSVAWPADPLPDLETAALAERTGHDALLVAPGELLPPGALTYTPSGRTTATVAGGDLTVLVPDARLSEAFLSGVVGPLDGTETHERPGEVTPTTAGQDLLAELAVITRERPSDGRHMLVTVPRDWMADADRVDGQLDALTAAPWVRFEPLSALVGLADPELDRGTLPDRVVDEAEVDAAALGTVRDAVERRTNLASIVASPEELLGDLELEQLAPTSVAWRADPSGRAEAVQASHDTTRALSGAVTVQPPGQLNLIATSGNVPVQVTNTLDQPVTIAVGLRTYDARLVADKFVTVTLEPGTEQLVTVPVHAVSSADVRVAVELRTPDGGLLDDSTEFVVTVRAEWESIGAAVLGGLLVLGLVVGLVRTVRRGRSRRRARPQASSGPDALSPEEHDDEAARTPQAHTTSPTPDDAAHAIGTAPAPHVVQGRDDEPPAQEASRT